MTRPRIAASAATAALAAGSAGNDAGCDTFVSQQDRLAAHVAANTGYALNSEGKLTAFDPAPKGMSS